MGRFYDSAVIWQMLVIASRILVGADGGKQYREICATLCYGYVLCCLFVEYTDSFVYADREGVRISKLLSLLSIVMMGVEEGSSFPTKSY